MLTQLRVFYETVDSMLKPTGIWLSFRRIAAGYSTGAIAQGVLGAETRRAGKRIAATWSQVDKPVRDGNHNPCGVWLVRRKEFMAHRENGLHILLLHVNLEMDENYENSRLRGCIKK